MMRVPILVQCSSKNEDANLSENLNQRHPIDAMVKARKPKRTLGRYLNGVPASDVCGTLAMTATGEFVQAFESIQARDPGVFVPQWSDAVAAAFPPKH